MKKIALLSLLAIVLTGCPIGLDYAPGNLGTEKVDENLAGTWLFSESQDGEDHEVMKATFKKINDYSYSVTVLEKGEMYALETDDLTMYQTTIDGLNIMYLKPSNEDDYYLYQFVLKDKKTLVTADVSLLDGGIETVVSTESLRQQIIASKNQEEFLNLPTTTFKKQ